MDVAGFLCSLRNSSDHEIEGKLKIAGYALSQKLTDEPSTDVASKTIPRSVLSFVYGRAEEDAFYTSLLATAFEGDELSHVAEAAFFNRVVLQLTYQVRFALDQVKPEASIFIGSEKMFCASMLHANNIFGARILFHSDPSAQPAWQPEWSRYDNLELSRHLLTQGTVEETLERLQRDQRPNIGSVLIDLDFLPTTVKLSEIFSLFENAVNARTIYALSGNAEHILGAVSEFERRYPDAVVYCKTYVERRGSVDTARGMLSVWNIADLPDVSIRHHTPYHCTLVTEADRQRSISDIEHKTYRPLETVDIKEPIVVYSGAPLLPEITRALSAPRQLYHDVSYIPGAGIFVDGSSYFFISRDGFVSLDAATPLDEGLNTSLFKQSTISEDGLHQSVLRKTRIHHISGIAMPLAYQPTLHQFFSHFLIQCFPRLLLIDELKLKDVKIIVSDEIYPKQVEMLLEFGIPAENIIYFNSNDIIFADMMVVPKPWQLMFSAFTTGIYGKLKSKMNIKDSVGDRRILISREFRKTWRNQLNSAQLQHVLQQELNFEVIRPEKLSLREEIEMFSSSEIIAGAEGAGLYGACYSGPGRAVVSVSDGDYAMPILGSLATYTGFDLSYYFGISMRAEGDMSRRPGRLHCDYLVNPNAVVSTIKRTIEHLRS